MKSKARTSSGICPSYTISKAHPSLHFFPIPFPFYLPPLQAPILIFSANLPRLPPFNSHPIYLPLTFFSPSTFAHLSFPGSFSWNFISNPNSVVSSSSSGQTDLEKTSTTAICPAAHFTHIILIRMQPNASWFACRSHWILLYSSTPKPTHWSFFKAKDESLYSPGISASKPTYEHVYSHKAAQKKNKRAAQKQQYTAPTHQTSGTPNQQLNTAA